MKKKRVILAGSLVLLALVSAGCGKKQKTPAEVSEQQAQAASDAEPELVNAEPAVLPTPTPGELVDMEKAVKDEYSDISKIMGTKTPTAFRLPITNQTGGEIGEFYVRVAADGPSDEWGEDLVQRSFTMKNQEKALYYFNKDEAPDNGTMPVYDIRVSYTDTRSDCFFRKLPLSAMKELRLCMEGTGADGIPYARYTLSSNGSEQSTLEEVKERLGMNESQQEGEEEAQTDSSESAAAGSETQQAEQPAEEEHQEEQHEQEETETDTEYEEPMVDESSEEARSYIGQSLDALIAAMGDPQSSEYADEPETGNTGYHNYATFTVSTYVDENGNETVMGIW